MPCGDLLRVHPVLRRFVGWATRATRARCTSGFRTHGAQARLFQSRRGRRGVLPAAPPGHSAHERGLAVDLSGAPATLAYLGRAARSWGISWGGARDPVHFELR